MKAIFGLVRTDGAPVDPAHLERMGQGLASDFYRPNSFCISREAGLGASARRRVADSRAEGVLEGAGGLLLAASARLINRAQLARDLSLRLGDLAILSDGELILAAWQRWSADCVHRLEGDWHFALWDKSRRRLFLARDTHGTSSLYYRRTPGAFAFASLQKPLLALSPAARPDLLRMAQILAGVPGEGSRTGYAEIERLPPAHHLTLDAGGVQVARYWFPEALPDLPLDDEAALEAFLLHYRRAVGARLAAQGKTGLMLSGGLDSGSIAGLAAPLLAQRGEELLAFTSVPAAPPDPQLARRVPVDEGPLAGAVAEAVGNIALTAIDAAHISPLAGMARMLAVHDEPAYPGSNSFWLAAILGAAQAQGVTTLLTGTAGNDTVSWRGAPPLLTHLLAAGEPGKLWQEIRRMRARAGLSVAAILWTGLVKPLLRPVRDRWPGLGAGAQPDWAALSPIHPAFARQPENAGLLAWEAPRPDPLRADRQAWAAWRLGPPGRWLPPTFHFQDSYAFGLDVLDPTADKRLMEFCFALDVGHYHDGGQDRRLIRQAMRGILPEQVRLIRGRARQSADLVNRLHAHRDELQAAVARLARHSLAAEVIATDRLADVARQIAGDPAGVDYFTANGLLLRGLMVGFFLERF